MLSAIDLNKGMDDILFDSFCGRASVKNMMKECYLPTVESEDNLCKFLSFNKKIG